MRPLAMRRAAPLLALPAILAVAAAVLWWTHARQAPQAQHGRRPITGRLAGLAYAPPPVTRGGTAETGTNEGDSAEGGRTTSAGVAALLLGDTKSAVATLEKAAADQPACAACRSDLAAARIQLARNGDAYELVRALADADQALAIQPDMPEALFNRAAALEGLHIDAVSALAWHRYMTADPASEWHSEAVSRLAALHRSRKPDFKSQIPKLQAAARAGDRHRLDELVRDDPQGTRTYAETTAAVAWAEAELKGDSPTAAARLAEAAGIAAAVRRLSGESMADDALAIIGPATPEARRALAQAYLDYNEGRLAAVKRDITQAHLLLSRSSEEFRAAGSPMAFMASYYEANAAYDAHQSAWALTTIQTLRATAPPRYRALHASLHRLEGTVVGANGRSFEAFDRYSIAVRQFTSLGEANNAEQARTFLGSVWSALGDDHQAWQIYPASFRQFSAEGRLEGIQKALVGASETEMRRGHWQIARALLRACAELNPTVKNPRLTSWSTLWLAVSAAHVQPAAYAKELASARESADTVPDPSLRSDAQDDVRVAAAGLAVESDPRLALEMVTPSIDRAGTTRRGYRLPMLLATRAKARTRVGDWRGAVADLRHSIARVQEEEQSAAPDDLRDTFVGSTESLYLSLADALDHLGDTAGAFDAAEGGRARAILDRLGGGPEPAASKPLASADIVRLIPPDALLVRYVPLPDRLLTFTIRNGRLSRDSLPVRSDELTAAADRFLAAIHERNGPSTRRQAGDLFEMLLRPLDAGRAGVKKVIVIGDAGIARIPFAALWDRARNRYVVEDSATVTALSATLYVRNRGSAPVLTAPRLLAVGNPAFDRQRWPTLPLLLYSEREVARLASLYRDPVTLLGPHATPMAVSAQLATCDLAHLSAHAVVDEGDGHLSALLLSPSGADGGNLYAGDLMKLSLPRLRLVFLAGCSTSHASTGFGDVRSLAAAFQMAGARNVIGSLWDADDSTSATLTSRFYRELSRGAPPADALRTAQLALLQSPDPQLRETRAWSTFQLLGSGE